MVVRYERNRLFIRVREQMERTTTTGLTPRFGFKPHPPPSPSSRAAGANGLRTVGHSLLRICGNTCSAGLPWLVVRVYDEPLPLC